jgi:hypothetical protein
MARLAACRGAERMGALWRSPLQGMRETFHTGAKKSRGVLTRRLFTYSINFCLFVYLCIILLDFSQRTL